MSVTANFVIHWASVRLVGDAPGMVVLTSSDSGLVSPLALTAWTAK